MAKEYHPGAIDDVTKKKEMVSAERYNLSGLKAKFLKRLCGSGKEGGVGPKKKGKNQQSVARRMPTKPKKHRRRNQFRKNWGSHLHTDALQQESEKGVKENKGSTEIGAPKNTNPHKKKNQPNFLNPVAFSA